MRFASTPPTATASRAAPSATRSCTLRRSLPRFSLITISRCSERGPFFPLGLVFAALLAACTPEGPKFRSTDVTGAEFGRSLALTGQDGKPHTLADFRGKAVVLFFGFTHCPDICPTTLADLAGVMKKLGADAARVQV